mmetsp:Transcript_9079/g.10272  ORF Transcript_9079/g.10272 Transcript_9079/m.10272 type:complete len:175 (+) Transcript_9079:21-545(+)
MNKNEFYKELKEKRTEKLFWKNFDDELAQILAAKKNGTYEESNFRPDDYKEIKPNHRPVEFTVEGDDKYNTKLWTSFLKDSAFYYDTPHASDKVELKNKIQLRYDSLFSSSWRAPLNNRRELLLWTCQQRNNYMTENGNESGLEQCEFNTLVDKYGPDYKPIREKLGYIKGLCE